MAVSPALRDTTVAQPCGDRNLGHEAYLSSGAHAVRNARNHERPNGRLRSLHIPTRSSMRTYAHVLSRFARHLTLAIAAAVVPASIVAAQGAEVPVGRITGRIIDATTGQGVAAAGLQVVGTTIGTQSGVDGRYIIARVPAGTVTLQVRRIGYGPKTVTGIIVPANGALTQDISLSNRRTSAGCGKRHREQRTRHGQRSARQAAHRYRDRELRHGRADRQKSGW